MGKQWCGFSDEIIEILWGEKTKEEIALIVTLDTGNYRTPGSVYARALYLGLRGSNEYYPSKEDIIRRQKKAGFIKE